MEVIFCSPLLSYPGHFLRIALDRASAMQAAGLELTVIGFRQAFQERFASQNLRYRSLEGSLSAQALERSQRWAARFGKTWIVIIENFRTTLLALKYARARRADLVYISDLEPWIIALLALLGYTRKLKVAGFVPYPYFAKSTAFSLPFFSFCRALLNHCLTPLMPRLIDIICDNPFTAQQMFGAANPQPAIVPEGFDRLEPTPQGKQAARASLGIPADKRALLVFGVDNQNKGIQFLYEALQGLDPNFILMVVGGVAKLFKPLDSRRKQSLPLWQANLIIVPRFVGEEERALYFAACDGVALPFRRGFFTTSSGLRDAISNGKAVIASDQYELGDMVKKYRLGLLFPPEDIVALRACLSQFASQTPQWFADIEQRARQVLAEYSWDKIGPMYKNTFNAILTQRASRGRRQA